MATIMPVTHSLQMKLKWPFCKDASKYGFKGELHFVTTQDDYILQVFRIRNESKSEFKPAIYMQHGSQCCSLGFLSNQDQSPAFILAK